MQSRIQSAIQSLIERLKSFFTLLAPPRLVSWQSLFLFGLAMWALSGVVALADPERAFDLYVLRRVGWFFVAGGIVWRQALDPVKIGGFPVGAIAAASVLVNFFFEDTEGSWTQAGFIALPILTGLLVAMSYFLSTAGRWRIPNRLERLKSIVALGIGLVLACWLNFYFATQDWMVRYPRLWDAPFEHSGFMSVVNDPRQSWGQDLVAEVDRLLYVKFQGRPWPEVEKTLQQYRNQPDRLKTDLTNSSGGSPFRISLGRDWNVVMTASGDGDPSYRIVTRVSWDSPLFFDDRDFGVIRVCEVRRAPLPLELYNEAVQTGLISCNTSPEFIFRENIMGDEAMLELESEAESTGG